jgi:hypothetical protein
MEALNASFGGGGARRCHASVNGAGTPPCAATRT